MRAFGIVVLAAGLLLNGACVFAADNARMSEQGVAVQQTKEAAPKAVEVGNKVCPVSGQEVENMGQAVKYEYKGKIYNFCCAGCIATFESDPEKYSKIAQDSLSE